MFFYVSLRSIRSRYHISAVSKTWRCWARSQALPQSKYKLYAIKVGVSVLPTGIAAFCTDHYPGLVLDITIILKPNSTHEKLLEKDGL